MIYATKSDEGDVVINPELATNDLEDTKCQGHLDKQSCEPCSRYAPDMQDNVRYFIAAPRFADVDGAILCEMRKLK